MTSSAYVVSCPTCPNCGFALLPPPPLPMYPRPTEPSPGGPDVAGRDGTHERQGHHHNPPEVTAPTLVTLPERRGFQAATVPQLLLGLGALCVLVAAVIFLAVAWSWLGLGGRTLVLLSLTGGALLGGHSLAGHRLRWAAEALTTIGLGLVVLDGLGAWAAGWVAADSVSGFSIALGGVLLAVALASVLADRLVVSQLAAPLGLTMAVLGIASSSSHGQAHGQAIAAGAVLAFAGLATVGVFAGTRLLPVAAGVAAAVAWLTLLGLGLADASLHATLDELWPGRHGWGLLAATLLVLPGVAVRSDAVRQGAGALAAGLLTLTIAMPGLDDGVDRMGQVAVVATLVWALVAAATPPRWYAVPRVPLAGAAAVTAAIAWGVASSAVGALATVGPVWTASAVVRLDPAPALAATYLLPAGVAALALAGLLTLPRRGSVVVAAMALLLVAGFLTLASFPLPLWLFVALLDAAGAVLLVDSLRREGVHAAGLAAGAAGLTGLATALALPSVVLTTLALTVIVAGTVATAARARWEDAVVAASLVLPIATAGLLWSAGELAGISWLVRSIVVLALVGLLTVQRPRVETEAAGWASVAGVSVWGISSASDVSVALSVHLTLAGVILCASAVVHRDRRQLAWAGGLLLAAASWLRLAEIGVHAPEPYTLPSALVLLWFGLRRLNRDDEAGTMTALGSGLVLATVPTLWWALVDPTSLRALLLGAACLGLVLAGANLRWHAPLVVGAAVGVALVLRELAPYLLQTPQWVAIGLAGTLLIGTGVTWESRVRDLQRTAGYLGRLR